jgi:hypothetical protein
MRGSGSLKPARAHSGSTPRSTSDRLASLPDPAVSGPAHSSPAAATAATGTIKRAARNHRR